MREVIQNCPACKEPLQVDDYTMGDWTNYSCPTHGNFSLTKEVSTILLGMPEAELNVAEYLKRHAARKDVIFLRDVGLN